jgi:hypothetical protein
MRAICCSTSRRVAGERSGGVRVEERALVLRDVGFLAAGMGTSDPTGDKRA